MLEVHQYSSTSPEHDYAPWSRQVSSYDVLGDIRLLNPIFLQIRRHQCGRAALRPSLSLSSSTPHLPCFATVCRGASLLSYLDVRESSSIGVACAGCYSVIKHTLALRKTTWRSTVDYLLSCQHCVPGSWGKSCLPSYLGTSGVTRHCASGRCTPSVAMWSGVAIRCAVIRSQAESPRVTIRPVSGLSAAARERRPPPTATRRFTVHRDKPPSTT